jgi:hypothetical protein
MPGVTRYPSVNAFGSFVDSPDSIYGTASDGSVVISANTSLTADKYYYNLEINANTVLNTAGYRVFVKNILTLHTGSTIGVGTTGTYTMTTGFSGSGSLQGGGASGVSVTNSLGGNSATQTATAPSVAQGGTGDKTTTSGYWYQPFQAIKGYIINASNTTALFLRGGAGGASGPGGGVLILSARFISCDASGTNAKISATGATGSGGGGGGVVLINSAQASLPTNVSTDVTGGTSCIAGSVIYTQVI